MTDEDITLEDLEEFLGERNRGDVLEALAMMNLYEDAIGLQETDPRTRQQYYLRLGLMLRYAKVKQLENIGFQLNQIKNLLAADIGALSFDEPTEDEQEEQVEDGHA